MMRFLLYVDQGAYTREEAFAKRRFFTMEGRELFPNLYPPSYLRASVVNLSIVKGP
jgi:hypothetical protein